jgi:hypothetical protein
MKRKQVLWVVVAGTIFASLLLILSTQSLSTTTHEGTGAHVVEPIRSPLLTFLVVGDWGVDLGDPVARKDQLAVARSMRSRARVLQPQFVLSTGDQAYPSGVNSIHEAYVRFRRSFTSTYGRLAAETPWYWTPGNRKCGAAAAAAAPAWRGRLTAVVLPCQMTARPLSRRPIDLLLITRP